MKILAVSSAGGHFSELMKVVEGIENQFEIVIATEKRAEDNRVKYSIPYSNRASKVKYCFAFIRNLLFAFKHIKSEKPDIILSTGAHTAFFYFIVGKKLFGTKNVYIESYAKVNSQSVTYKLSKKYLDQCIVQHEEMLDVETGSEYFGGVY